MEMSLLHKPYPVPERDYSILSTLDSFCLLAEVEDELAQDTTIDTVLDFKVLRDEDYYMDNEDAQPIGERYYDIKYIRETRLKNVIASEWSLMYGPRSLKTYFKYFPEANPDSHVKVFLIESLKYDLKQLNRQYTNPTKFGR